MANLTIRMDDELKKDAQMLFAELGMNLSTAITLFAKQAVREQRIPFEVSMNIPNAETIAALEEGERIARDKSIKGYTDMKSLRASLGV